MYIYTVTVACVSIILDFFLSPLITSNSHLSLFLISSLTSLSSINSLISSNHLTLANPCHRLKPRRWSIVDQINSFRSRLLVLSWSLICFFFFWFFGWTWGCRDSYVGVGWWYRWLWVWVGGLPIYSLGCVFWFFFCWMPVSILLLSGRLEARLMIVVAWWQWLWGLCWEMTMLKEMIILLNKCIE